MSKSTNECQISRRDRMEDLSNVCYLLKGLGYLMIICTTVICLAVILQK